VIDAVCLAEVQTEYIQEALSGGFIGLLLGLLIVASLVAVAVAPFVLRRYDGQVRRLMRLQQRAALPDAWMAKQSRAFSPSPAVDGSDRTFDQSTLTELENASGWRLSLVRRATWIAYGVFVAASFVLAPVLGTALATPDLVGYFIAVCFVGAVPAFVNVRPQGSKTFVLAGSVVLGVVLSVLEGAAAPAEAEPLDALWAPLLLGALYFTIAHRKLRSVVIPLTLLFTVVLGGILAAFWALMFVSCLQQPTDALAWSLASTTLALATLVAGGSVYGGRKVIDAVARLQERGFVSDISISAGMGLTFIALLFAVGLGIDSGFAMWQIALAGALWAGLACAAYAVVVRRGAKPTPAKSLLVLRVFSRSRAAERLLDAMQTDWRYVGPVNQIAGPDLVRLNVDLYEFGKFVNAKVHEVFLFGAVTREQLLARLVRHPDREGRFRVNEVFCLETAWRGTVEQMMEMSDAILLDVRGFGPERRGTAFELELLVRRGFIHRVVAIGDQTTSWGYFDERIRNAGGNAEVVVREHITGPKDSSARFVRALMRVAAGETASEKQG
jgi:hypothetical protein